MREHFEPFTPIEIALQVECLVIDTRDLTPEAIRENEITVYQVAKLLKTLGECFKFDRITKRINMDELVKIPIAKMRPVVLKDDAAQLLAKGFTDGREWSNPSHNIVRHLFHRNLKPLVPGKPHDRRQPIFDAACLNDFLERNNGKIKTEWNLIDIPISDLERDVGAMELADIHKVAPSTIRSHRRRHGIPPFRPGRMGGLKWGLLWANYKAEPLENWLNELQLAEYKAEKSFYDDWAKNWASGGKRKKEAV